MAKIFVINQPIMSCCGAPKKSKVHNSFCPTGEGGGVDPTCSPGRGPGVLSLPDQERRVLKLLGDRSMSIGQVHRSQPGMISARTMYIETVMPIQSLVSQGFVEKVGSVKGYIGVGASYAGPGSAPVRAEKDDPARDIYRLTERGRETMGLPPRAATPSPDPEPGPSKAEYRETRTAVLQGISSLRMKISSQRSKPRLMKESEKKLRYLESELARINGILKAS